MDTKKSPNKLRRDMLGLEKMVGTARFELATF